MSFEMEKALDNTYVMGTYGRSPVEFVRGDGMRLWDSEGREYRDFLAGIGVACLGYGHPAVVEAASAQVARLQHTCNYFYVPGRAELAALLSKLACGDREGAAALVAALDSGDEQAVLAAAAPAPGEQVWKTFFANSGAEANEGALKLARLWAKRRGGGGNTVVALRGSFHGRTLTTLAATMQDWLQEDFRPLPGGFVACTPNDTDELRGLFDRLGSEICAVLYEPIQGESGVHPLTSEFMEIASELAHTHGALLVADEVQTGIFRSGEPFAFQTYGVEPDIMSLAKGIAGGIPMGAFMAKAEVADAFAPGDHGSTFGGSNVAVATSLSVLSELVRGRYDRHAAEVGEYFHARLAGLPHVLDVRGAGLMVGCDVDGTVADAHDVVAAGLEAGFVFNATGARSLRFLPPLICEREDVDALIAALTEILG